VKTYVKTLTLLLSIGMCAAAVQAAAAVKGTVILTKSSPVAALFWEATPRVYELTNMQIPESARVRLLETDALSVLIARAPSTKADEMTIQVVYLLSPVASQYGTPTMVGKGKILFMQAKTKDVIANGPAWASAIAAGHVPNGLTAAVQGKFPQ
jgi:methionine-rich copper-binding protein CopC